jgi:hypothetical protein
MPSKTQINKAGDYLRDWWMNPNIRAQAPEGDDPLVGAVGVAIEWRLSIQKPLNTVTQGLRQFVRGVRSLPASTPVPVAQRLKRMITIVDKLARMPTTNLTQLQDIGGCRAVLDSQAEVAAVLARIVKNWDLRGDPRDYVVHPKSSGYRAVHVVTVKRDRLIEVQLRTRGQHEWAVAMERASVRLREPVKFGVGPPELLRFMAMAAEGIALEESGAPVDEGFMREFQKLRQAALPYLPPRGPAGE